EAPRRTETTTELLFSSDTIVLLLGYSGWLSRRAALFDVVLCATFFCAQTGPTATPAQTPHTSPQIKEVLPSYEGQNVSSVELAGQPELDAAKLVPLLAQREKQPFSQAKIDATVAALKELRRFNDVQIQI